MVHGSGTPLQVWALVTLWPGAAAVACFSIFIFAPVRRPTLRIALVRVAFVALSITGEIRTMSVLDTPWQKTLTLQELILPLEPAEISYDTNHETLYGRNGYQFWLRGTEFLFFDSSTGKVPATDLVLSRRDWPAAEALGARLIARESRLDEALWVLPGALQQAQSVREASTALICDLSEDRPDTRQVKLGHP
jgi:hypothetical protein